MTSVVLVLTTVPEGDLGETSARKLVEERLAGCVNVLALMTAVYRWQGALERWLSRQPSSAAVQAASPSCTHTSAGFTVLNVADGSTAYLACASQGGR